MVHSKADVVVIGAGPSGSLSAMTAAKLGAEVIVCEDHKEVGLPSHCAGHISIEGLKRLGLNLPKSVVENEIKGSVFYSPSGYEFRVRLASPVTYVVNRPLFDMHLAQLSEKAGSELRLETRVKSLLLDHTYVCGVSLKGDGEIPSRIVIDAEGCASAFVKEIGFTAFDRSLAVNAINCEIEHVQDTEEDMVELYFGQKYASGLFAWIIPRRNGSAKVGLASRAGNPRECLEHFLKSHPVARTKLRRGIIKNVSYHLIPLGGPIRKTYHNGFLIVGDAASQVKPTTGGGVVMGLTCAKIAGQVAYEALTRGDFSANSLRHYQERWKRTIGFDMSAMLHTRFLLNHLSDSHLDKIIRLCSQFEFGKNLKKVTDIDFQGRTLISLLKSPSAWAIVMYAVFKSLSSLQT